MKLINTGFGSQLFGTATRWVPAGTGSETGYPEPLEPVPRSGTAGYLEPEPPGTRYFFNK